MLDTVSPLLHTNRNELDRSAWYAGGFLVTFLATSEETGGAFSLVEAAGQKASGSPPMHTQTREKESFYVIEGEVTFYVGDEVIEARPGTWVTMPRGVPHSFKVTSDDVRILILCVPGGFEGFFRDLSVPAPSLSLPPLDELDEEAHDLEKLKAVCPEYGVEIVGPPPA